MKVYLSRRLFLLGATAFSLPAFAHVYRGDGMPWVAGQAFPPWHGTENALFFTVEERNAAEALAARLIPSDDTGPGAREANVVTFLERQLAGFYGRAERWYMRGPFADQPLDTQGYQTELTPAALWRAGLAGLDAHARQQHGKPFADLSEEVQDEILTAMEAGEITFESVSAKLFFGFALEMTVEGFFCDPVYGGNRDMAGWRYVGFPGARYDYRDFLDHGGAPIDLAPVSIAGGPHWDR